MHCTVTTSGQAKLLQRFEIELEDDRIGAADKADRLCPLEIALVGVLVETLVVLEMMLMEGTVGNVLFELLRVHRAFAVTFAVGATESGERADAWRALVIDDVIGIAARVFGRAVGSDETWQLEART